MKRHVLFASTFVLAVYAVQVAGPALAQSAVGSMSELMERQANQQAQQAVNKAIADSPAIESSGVATSQDEASGRGARKGRKMRGRRSKRRGGNVQRRRGNTSGAVQEQIGEGNVQSISAGG